MSSYLSFRWLGAAGFELRFGSTNVLVDPFLSRGPQARPALNLRLCDLSPNAVFLTHGHFDHAYDVPAIAQHTGIPVYASSSVCEALHDQGIPARQLHPLAGGRVCRVGAVTVLAFPSRHVRFDLALVWRGLRRVGGKVFRLLQAFRAHPCGDVLGYRFACQEGTVVHLGSAGWYRDSLMGLSPDVALIPLQGRADIYRVAAQMVELLRPRRVVPHHHDDFYPPLSEMIDVQPWIDLLGERFPDVKVIEPVIDKWTPLFVGAYRSTQSKKHDS